MIKQILLAGLVVAGLIIGGVLEVQVHPEEISKVPGRVKTFATNPERLGSLKVTFVDLKRSGEQMLTRDDKKKLELTLLYVKQDAEQVNESEEPDEDSPAKALPAAQLLAKSLNRAEAQLESADVETLLAMKEKSQESFSEAEEALSKLQERREKYEEVREQFASTVGTLEKSFDNIVAIVGSKNKESAVAGAKDEVSSPSPTPTATIPLKF